MVTNTFARWKIKYRVITARSTSLYVLYPSKCNATACVNENHHNDNGDNDNQKHFGFGSVSVSVSVRLRPFRLRFCDSD